MYTGSSLQSNSAGNENQMEYAFEMATSTIRFGRGATKEVGFDLKNLGIQKNVCVITDQTVGKLPPMDAVRDSLTKAGISFEVFDKVVVEPTDESVKVAIDFCRSKNFDGFVAVGGGSVLDTAKAANLYMCHPQSDFLDFVNAPIGKGLPVRKSLKPLIAIPTTAGTGSETTGVSIFDLVQTGAKTGIRDRAIRPTLGIVDPNHTIHCPPELSAFAGLDVLCHALESFTAVPFHKRSLAPISPEFRPAYQGCNPVSDIWSSYALQQCSKYLLRAVQNPDDLEAKEQMCLASTAAGVGFGNAGVHLCHAMSYPISSKVKAFKPKSGYSGVTKKAIVPHGLSVVLTAPAVFQWTAEADFERHLKAAEYLGANVINKKAKDSGLILRDYILNLLNKWNFVPDGLSAIGYDSKDIDVLVKGTMPQRKVLDVAPKQVQPDNVAMLLENSMKLFTS